MLKIYSDFSIGLFILSVNYPVCGMSHRVSIYRADQGVEFHIRRWLGSVVYITSSRIDCTAGLHARGYMRDSLFKS